MKTFSRRDMLKTSLLAPAAVAAAQGMGPIGAAMEVPHQPLEPSFEPPLRDAEKYATYGVVITESGQHFLGIVGGILDVARAETK